MDLLGAHAEELIRQGRNTGNDEDDTEEYGAVLRAGLQSLQRVRRLSIACMACEAGMRHCVNQRLPANMHVRPLRHSQVSQQTCMPCLMLII